MLAQLSPRAAGILSKIGDNTQNCTLGVTCGKWVVLTVDRAAAGWSPGAPFFVSFARRDFLARREGHSVASGKHQGRLESWAPNSFSRNETSKSPLPPKTREMGHQPRGVSQHGHRPITLTKTELLGTVYVDVTPLHSFNFRFAVIQQITIVL